MPCGVSRSAEDHGSGFTAPHISTYDRAGERLHTYAHVQKKRLQQIRQAQSAVDAARLFHPHISELARSPCLTRAPLYAASKKTASTSSEAAGASPSPFAAAQMSPAHWDSFLSRSAAHERHRSARLRELKLQTAEDAVRECTFRPRVGRLPEEAVDQADAPSPRVLDQLGNDAVAQQWMRDLEIFNREMELLKEELTSLRQVGQTRHTE
ncbi:hypothetical protein ABB37_06607 [Leptomonas pyrrhocoris]|uniref:Uncharacterized protein n=1 Tax=Leptomonas pyrrhocoris TaxID=157538 RepID=A0A0M9FX50_LEPPY|nr:hypothetical protein ABB37_06607 [Leptomonas pyrrhocoris]XP_015656212.1 hypothetical protein ABB37_06607 [Leptomonas pyrrhocoris]XP_015656213.1 hypothetical protein ABB37_06607 [Leptomonas pyrrhocoris]KPA77772.1 hypothetical protein ABB37_06607 [Leptomonas pyrrhocoris]KPA77773.1 hypothetical protein ABB37_06607 [Leptomonas pyrrhocoris]KPA77774.1 hypothetical protein ABB37_06607 [Leptomonas pyrrhocoris]|eukprot:XP_015656211.1 hypothetical protein ABB37_06607 [Leptomonas pyrrhocoris]